MLFSELEIQEGIVAVARKRHHGKNHEQQRTSDLPYTLYVHPRLAALAEVFQHIPQHLAQRCHRNAAEDQEEYVVLEQQPDRMIEKSVAVQAEHPFERGAEERKVVKLEKNPAEIDNQQNKEMPQNGIPMLQAVFQNMLFQHEKYKEIQSPEDIVPACAMPHTGQRPDNEHIKNLAALAAAIPSQRNIDVIAEEGAQRNMPSAPEIRNGIGHIRIIEVFFIVEAAHQTHADCHIGIGRKIEVDLQHIGKHAEPHSKHRNRAERFCRIGKQAVGNRSAAVCKHRLFCKSDCKTGNAVAHFGSLDLTVQNIMVHVPIADNRAGNTLMEQSGIQQQQPVFLLRLRIAAVDIDHIRNQLERVERNADRQRDLRNDLWKAGQKLDVLQEEAGIFENAQRYQHQRHADNHCQLFAPFVFRGSDDFCRSPADKCHAQQQNDVTDSAPCVKHHGKRQHYNIFLFNIRHQRLNRNVRRKKQEDEQQAGEYQVPHTFLINA